MKQAYLLLGVLLVAGFALTGTAAAQAASASVEGACTYEDQGQQDSATIATDGTAEGPEALDENVAACAAAAQNGELPQGGSYLAGSASVADGAVDVGASSVPISDLFTGVSDSASSSVQAEGACNYGDTGGQSAGGVTLDSDDGPAADEPDQGEAEDGLTACANAASNGDTPEGGSYLRLSASAVNGAATASVDTVPLSDAAP